MVTGGAAVPALASYHGKRQTQVGLLATRLGNTHGVLLANDSLMFPDNDKAPSVIDLEIVIAALGQFSLSLQSMEPPWSKSFTKEIETPPRGDVIASEADYIIISPFRQHSHIG